MPQLTVTFDVQRMAEDAALMGWTKSDFAFFAGVSDMTVIRFLRGEYQTPRTAAKLSRALGHNARHYAVLSSSSSSSSAA